MKIVSLKSLEIVARIYARVLYSYSRLMVDHFEKVGLSMIVENIMKLGRPTFSENFVALCMASILFSNSDCSSMSCSRKRVYEA